MTTRTPLDPVAIERDTLLFALQCVQGWLRAQGLPRDVRMEMRLREYAIRLLIRELDGGGLAAVSGDIAAPVGV